MTARTTCQKTSDVSCVRKINQTPTTLTVSCSLSSPLCLAVSTLFQCRLLAREALLTLLHHCPPANPKQKSIKATCKTCTPGQTTELRCCICNHDKGLDRFSKNQRKNPDTARCIAYGSRAYIYKLCYSRPSTNVVEHSCVEKHLDTEPDVTPPSSDSYSSEDDDSSGVRVPVQCLVK